MKKRDLYILGGAVIVLIIIFANPFEKKNSQDINVSDQNLTDVECTLSINCGQVFIEKYCVGNSSYQKLHDFSCVDKKCVEEVKEAELIEDCTSKTGKYECIEGVCEPIAVPISACDYYLNTEGEFYKLTKNIAGVNLTEPCITILKDDVTFDCDGHTISSENAYAGVSSDGNSGITIKNCKIEMSKGKGGYGIYLYNNVHSNILNNTLNNQYMGLYLEWDSYAVIKGNTIKDNNSTGIWIEKGIDFEISDNYVCGNNHRDLRLRSVNNVQGTGNVFDNINQASSGWPILDTDYVNCTS